jgi:hypothetical protein
MPSAPHPWLDSLGLDLQADAPAQRRLEPDYEPWGRKRHHDTGRPQGCNIGASNGVGRVVGRAFPPLPA